jgi:hypothetical protein
VLVEVVSPKSLTIQDLIRWLEERIVKCEETLKILKEAELRHPHHIKIREYYMEITTKELKELKKSLEYLRKVSKY